MQPCVRNSSFPQADRSFGEYLKRQGTVRSSNRDQADTSIFLLHVLYMYTPAIIQQCIILHLQVFLNGNIYMIAGRVLMSQLTRMDCRAAAVLLAKTSLSLFT